jgi:hypothetical protein
MLRERTFRVVFVTPGQPVGSAAAAKADRVLKYTGAAVAAAR